MVNKVILIGNLGQDPEIRSLDSGQKVCSFSLATNENYQDKSGEWQSMTEWHRIVIWGDLAQRTFDRLKKGHKAYLEGKIRTRKWQDKEGKDRYSTDIICRICRSLERTESKNSDFPPKDNGTQEGKWQTVEPTVSQGADDLPF